MIHADRRVSFRSRCKGNATSFPSARPFSCMPKSGLPARGERFALRVHVRLVRQFVALAGVAAEARGDDVVPAGAAAAFVAGQDVVEVGSWVSGSTLAIAILAQAMPELVAQKHIAAGEFHPPAAAERSYSERHDDLRHPDGDLRGVDHFLAGRGSGRLTDPRRKIVGY